VLQLLGHAVVAPERGGVLGGPAATGPPAAFYGKKEPFQGDGKVEAFYDFVADGTGNSSIPTSLGRRHHGGCACRYPHGISAKMEQGRASRGARDAKPSDDEDNVPFCFSTFAGKHMPGQPEQMVPLLMNGKTADPVNKENSQKMFANRHCNAGIVGENAQIDEEVKDLITECLTPNRKLHDHPEQTIFLLGDSHSAAILPALVLAVRGAYQVRHVYSDVVGLFPHRTHEESELGVELDSNPGRFVDVYNYILKTLKAQMVQGDVVVLSMHASNFNHGSSPSSMSIIARQDNGPVGDVDLTAVDLMERDLLEGVVGPAHGRLFILGDWPYFPDVRKALHRASGVVKVDGQAKLQAQLEPLLERHPALRYKSLVPMFCTPGTALQNNWTTTPKGACSSTIPGTNLHAFADDTHLSTVGSIYMWPHLCDLFEDDSEAQRLP
jgi:hypothetical protein